MTFPFQNMRIRVRLLCAQITTFEMLKSVFNIVKSKSKQIYVDISDEMWEVLLSFE